MSREGTIALSWPIASNYKMDFELTKWHKRFFGVFLLLAAHVQGGIDIMTPFIISLYVGEYEIVILDYIFKL
jgi:hypothetical protein